MTEQTAGPVVRMRIHVDLKENLYILGHWTRNDSPNSFYIFSNLHLLNFLFFFVMTTSAIVLFGLVSF